MIRSFTRKILIVGPSAALCASSLWGAVAVAAVPVPAASSVPPEKVNQAAVAPLAESKGNTIGYLTVAAALAALQSRKDVQFQTSPDGWVVAYIPAEYTIWTFSPKTNPAYPAAVKRVITKQGDGSYIDMHVLCEASKAVCDDLVRQFEQLNEQVKQSLSKKQ